MTDQSTPEFEDVLSEYSNAAVGGVHTSEPGRVLDYDEATQTATVQPVIRAKILNAATEELVPVLPAPISNVPVAFPQGGGYSITWPLDKGDRVDLIYAERSIDEWAATDADDNTAQDPRRHDRTDAIAIPGPRSPSNPLPGDAVDTSSMVVSIPDNEYIVFGSASVSTFLARADLVEDRLQAIETVLNTHEHAYVSPGGPATTTGKTATVDPKTQDGGTASNKIKGD